MEKDNIDVLVSRYMRMRRKRLCNMIITPIKLLLKTNKNIQ
tara:strand:+ start:11740 stop:11862 length:123 start_codon:yes stop_codon:yes gene_type:complete